MRGPCSNSREFRSIFDSLKKAGWIADAVGARVEFSYYDGRDEEPPDALQERVALSRPIVSHLLDTNICTAHFRRPGGLAQNGGDLDFDTLAVREPVSEPSRNRL